MLPESDHARVRQPNREGTSGTLSESPAVTTITSASAIIRQDGSVLLVYQHRAQHAYPTWTLPGGRLEPHESLAEGLVREVREETGLVVQQIGPLVSVAHLINKAENLQVISFVFQVEAWSGTPAPEDPDKVVTEARFFSIEDAIMRMEHNPWRDMFEPAASYLRGERPAGTVWLYDEHEDEETLTAVLPEQVST